MERTNVIVDLLGELQIVIYPKSSKHVVGKFTPETSQLSYKLALERALNIVLLIVQMTLSPEITFYIQGNWQSFGIVNSVSKFFSINPVVYVVTNVGEMIDMSGFSFATHEGVKFPPKIESAHVTQERGTHNG